MWGLVLWFFCWGGRDGRDVLIEIDAAIGELAKGSLLLELCGTNFSSASCSILLDRLGSVKSSVFHGQDNLAYTDIFLISDGFFTYRRLPRRSKVEMSVKPSQHQEVAPGTLNGIDSRNLRQPWLLSISQNRHRELNADRNRPLEVLRICLRFVERGCTNLSEGYLALG